MTDSNDPDDPDPRSSPAVDPIGPPDPAARDGDDGKPRRRRLFGLLKGWRGRNGETGHTLEDFLEQHGEHAETALDGQERQLLGNILHLRDQTAYDVMIPRADIVAVEVDMPLIEAVRLGAGRGHSRLPIYRDNLDDVIGMIHIKDLLPALTENAFGCDTPGCPKPQDGQGEPPGLGALVRPVLFVAPTARVLDLLLEMRLKRLHMAMVVDEYGGIDGLITIEDLVEQIVGEIEDEHDIEVEPEILPRPDGSVIADARVPLEDFEERFGALFSDDEKEEADTLGGLVFLAAGRVPARGELIAHPSGLTFEILDGDPRRVRRLRLRNIPTVDWQP
ncbi:hemolysin family protein [Roseospirillum parvum]|uniref:CBS domain-containing protein n=1 Tax=Roseospirillum parvum TaxID=83401 RepID=A0A1G8DM35_9PROT|nr:hemolysin family protein [Roseospirillum parvum]SDH58707.1 CBS domain-containing protein [Roseospirillum parvum]